MIHLEIFAHRMSSSRVCTATLNTYYCHALCHPGSLWLPRWNLSKHILLPRKTPITATPSSTPETFYCHAKHLLLPRPLPPCKPLLPRQNLSKHISLPRPYHTRKPLLPHHCHTTATPLPHHCHTAATQLPHHTTATGCLNMWFQFQYIGGFLRLKSNSLNKKIIKLSQHRSEENMN